MEYERRSSRLMPLLVPLLLAPIFSAAAFIAFKDLSTAPRVVAGTSIHQDHMPAASPDDSTPKPTRILLGVPINNGKSDKLFVFDPTTQSIKEQSVPDGWRVTMLEADPTRIQIPTQLGDPTELITASGTKIVLQTGGSSPYQSAQVIGGFDPQNTAVVANQIGSGQTLLSVDPKSGQVQEVAPVPQNSTPLSVSHGTAWFSTYQSCGGIESAPIGPSSLIGIGLNGVSSTVATDPQHVIIGAVAGPSGAVAYTLDTGQTTAISGNLRWTGTGKPLMWQDDKTLILSVGNVLEKVSLTDGSLTTLSILPQAPTVASTNN